MIALVMVLSLAACGGKTDPVKPAPDDSGTTSETTPETPEPQNGGSGEVAPAVDGTITLSKADIAVVVNGTVVPMPYTLKALEEAGVPVDESYYDIELGSGDMYSLNLYLDENEDYLVVPIFDNKGDSAITIAEAEATSISVSSYLNEPEDIGLSILGISLGMQKGEVTARFGEPSYDDGTYSEWQVEVPDIDYEGHISMYFSADGDDAVVNDITLSVVPSF